MYPQVHSILCPGHFTAYLDWAKLRVDYSPVNLSQEGLRNSLYSWGFGDSALTQVHSIRGGERGQAPTSLPLSLRMFGSG